MNTPARLGSTAVTVPYIESLHRGAFDPAYMDSTRVYNFTGEEILFMTADGNQYLLPSTHHPDYLGNVIVRREIQWTLGAEWQLHLNDYQQLTDGDRANLLDYMTAAGDKDVAHDNGGYHTCRLDALIPMPSVDNPNNTVSSTHPDVVIGRVDGKRSMRMSYREKHGELPPLPPEIMVGIVIEKGEVATGVKYAHIAGFVISCLRVHSEGLPTDSIICLLTGNVIYHPSKSEDAEHLQIYSSSVEAIKAIRGLITEAFEDRFEEGDEALVTETNTEKSRLQTNADEKVKLDIAKEARELKRVSSISDMATSIVSAENKMDLDNTKTLVGLMASAFK